MSLKYEPASEPLPISVKWLFPPVTLPRAGVLQGAVANLSAKPGMKKTVKIGRPGYRVTKQRDPESGQVSPPPPPPYGDLLLSLGDRLRFGWLNGFTGGVPREHKMLKGYLPRVIYHQVH